MPFLDIFVLLVAGLSSFFSGVFSGIAVSEPLRAGLADLIFAILNAILP